MKGVKAMFLAVLFLCAFSGSTQSITGTAGGDANGSSGSVSFTVGQVVYLHHQNDEVAINDGVQQPYIAMVTGTEEWDVQTWNASVFPNPVSDRITLKVDPFEDGDFFFELLSTKGQLLRQGKITGTHTSIPLRDVAAGKYLLRVSGDEVQTFKIVVNH